MVEGDSGGVHLFNVLFTSSSIGFAQCVDKGPGFVNKMCCMCLDFGQRMRMSMTHWIAGEFRLRTPLTKLIQKG